MSHRKRPRNSTDDGKSTTPSADCFRSLITTEATLLQQIVTSRQRDRVYRHHDFYQSALRCNRLVQQLIQDPSNQKALDIERICRALLHAGAAAAVELRQQRIDTIPLCSALLSVYARLKHLLSEERCSHEREAMLPASSARQKRKSGTGTSTSSSSRSGLAAVPLLTPKEEDECKKPMNVATPQTLLVHLQRGLRHFIE